MENDLLKAYAEVDKILSFMETKYIDKIPQKVRDLFSKEKNKNHNPKININLPLEQQNLQRKTFAILAFLNLNYWCEDENQRRELIKNYTENDRKKEDQLKVKYDVDSIIKKGKMETKALSIDKEQETTYIKINNKQIENYIMFMLDKDENNFTEEELAKIEELVLNPVSINGEYNEIDLDIIKNFTNLKRIYFRNLTIPEKTIERLHAIKSLERIYFERCDFENISKLTKLETREIEFFSCNILDYSFLYNMHQIESLSIVDGMVSIKGINKLKNLEYLKLSYSIMLDIDIIELPHLKELHIDNTNIYDIPVISELYKLRKISISEDQFVENKKYYSNLIQRGIKVFNENMVEFNEESEIDEWL